MMALAGIHPNIVMPMKLSLSFMQRISRSISMFIWIEVRAIISMSLILWYNFVKCHSSTSISSADLFYFYWMTLTSSQVDTFHISRVFRHLIANKTPSSENFIFQMWIPSHRLASRGPRVDKCHQWKLADERQFGWFTERQGIARPREDEWYHVMREYCFLHSIMFERQDVISA